MITLTQHGDFKKTRSFFQRIKEWTKTSDLDKYGQAGVEALKLNTPKDTGATADAWTYKIEHKDGQVSIVWSNKNANDGVLIAILLQYGHGTGTGGYVQGIDYINPAMKPVFQKIADDAWKEVTKA